MHPSTLLKVVLQFISLTVLLVLTNTSYAATINAVRLGPDTDKTRLVLELNDVASYNYFFLTQPDRFVIDLKKTKLNARLDQFNLSTTLIKKIRHSNNNGTLRLVLDLRQAADAKVFILPGADNDRLVIDLLKKEQSTYQPSNPIPTNKRPNTQPVKQIERERTVLIAIDAGHGGKDSGAVGPKIKGKPLYEKHVVLNIAKYLQKDINAIRGLQAVLIRDDDTYISLRGRTQKARQNNADLFVSIHADAFKTPQPSGASVWVLSNKGASSEMGLWLAQTENKSDSIGDTIGGVKLDKVEPDLAMTLLDMSMDYSKTTSQAIAGDIHKSMDDIVKMHKSHVERAGFLVLKSPDIPSILVETGFISNPGEAAKLSTTAYQKKIAKAIAKGIKQYFYSNPPPNTLVASLVELSKNAIQYKVVTNDTLSHIASRYGIKLSRLIKANNLSNKSVIKVGQKLIIPAN